MCLLSQTFIQTYTYTWNAYILVILSSMLYYLNAIEARYTCLCELYAMDTI